ncbi:MAG: hypothetical protein NTX30_04300 [Deltaproteobacteria bacterium]|jgi:hypothetical protein|nr:hypothetical protein [Deltaproteobacteria bacterium]
MLLKSLIGMVLFTLVFSSGALAEKKEPAVEPAEGIESADKELSLDEGLFAVEIIRECLQSFRKLTEEAQGKISKAKMKEIGNTEWDMQVLGFHNNPSILEGTLKKQAFLIKQLQFELIKRQVKEGSAKEKDLQEARKALEASQKAFQQFKKNFHRKD